MELSLLRSLMNKDFYEDHRGARCPDRLFSKDARTIKHTIDKAMRKGQLQTVQTLLADLGKVVGESEEIINIKAPELSIRVENKKS